MVLELLIIGCVVYHYHQKHKVEKQARAAALASGIPPQFINKDGSISRTYQGQRVAPPPYLAPGGALPPSYVDRDVKVQSHVAGPVLVDGQGGLPRYTDVPQYTARDEKAR
ncbi:hypothetical protein PMZ80_007993 [Knufia obscura]|uniref:Uncharacterized protein n=2 Tax=Knufia TaxID=430999 RepID=A0AAN8ERK6_9EURO|nr:hypothetical protein PMZ80_007993 [Knufia obscura]KAK5957278.1 hypothetical protein OHC33_001650 [Knufia fluminis]